MLFKLFSTLEEIESPYNGKIRVVRDLEGTRIIAGGISQSGWLMKRVWKRAVARAVKDKPSVNNILIIGLGGGSAAEVAAKHWPQAKIVGIDIDEKIVEMGKKYLGLGKLKEVEVVIADAKEWTKTKGKDKYDVIFIDLFKGQDIPEFFTSEVFIKRVEGLLNKEGIALFNHLFSSREKKLALNLHKNLQKFFDPIVSIYPEANVVFLCFKKQSLVIN